MTQRDTAFLFPGQGSQAVGMLDALAAHSPVVRATFEEASEALGFDLWQLCQTGPEADLNRTENTQPAMLAAGIASWRAWQAQGGGTPAYMAGHSLGEYSALVAAEAMAFADAVRLVRRRGELMQEAVGEGEGAMAAIIGMDAADLERICEAAAGDEVVSCANYNAPGQIVIAGNAGAVARAAEASLEAGARRALPLPVSVPSHCLLMHGAAETLREELATVTIKAPTVPVIHNADVETHDQPESIREVLARQLWQPVRWTSTIARLKDGRIERLVECGPGKVLTGLNRRIDRRMGAVALTDPASLSKLQEEWNA